MKPTKTFIPAKIIDDIEINSEAVRFFMKLVVLTSGKKRCSFTNKELSTLYEVSESTIKRWIVALEGAGYIRREYNKESKLRELILIMPPKLSKLNKIS